MNTLIQRSLSQLNLAGLWLGLLSLRLVLGWEYFESGLEKYRGHNWFADIADRFPFPFDLLPTSFSWNMATWLELIGAIALLLGFGVRFFSASLFVLTLVAIASVHWPESWSSLGELAMGYALTDKGHGNFKLPVIFLSMLLPLMLLGSGRLGLDYPLCRRLFGRAQSMSPADQHDARHHQRHAAHLPGGNPLAQQPPAQNDGQQRATGADQRRAAAADAADRRRLGKYRNDGG